MVGRSVGRSLGRSVGHSVGRSVTWKVGGSVGRSVGWLTWPGGCLLAVIGRQLGVVFKLGEGGQAGLDLIRKILDSRNKQNK